MTEAESNKSASSPDPRNETNEGERKPSLAEIEYKSPNAYFETILSLWIRQRYRPRLIPKALTLSSVRASWLVFGLVGQSFGERLHCFGATRELLFARLGRIRGDFRGNGGD